MLGSISIVTILAAYLAVVGWMTAIYQYRRAEDFREKYEHERNRRLSEAASATIAGAGAELVRQLFGGKGGGGGATA